MLIHSYFFTILLLTTTSSLAGAPNEDESPASSSADGADMTFFMHDILGGSHPSTRAITGIVASPAGQIPFAKPRGANLPLHPRIPVDFRGYGFVNNDNVPLLTGLSGEGELNASSSVEGKMPAGSALQGLMFGTMTVIDNELTRGLELGSRVIGKAQGFYVVSTVEGDSQMMAFTAMFERGGYNDSLSFLGVHRTSVIESHLAVIGGTGEYVDAKGFAVLQSLPASAHEHRTDGLETLLKCAVYLL